jgi:cytochrome c oxidase assembly factor CtaG
MGPGNMAPIRINLHTLLRYWLISPFTCAILAALILAAFWYLQAAGDRAEQGQPWPVGRTVAFLSGLVAIELAFQSSVAMLPYISFPMHVVQKLLLVVVAPPLLAAGSPLALALETSSPTVTRRLVGALRSAPVSVLTHPVSTFFLLYLGLLAYFLTPALGASMRHVWLLNLINLAFLAAASLFWWVVVDRDPVPSEAAGAHKLALLGGAVVAESALGIALIASTKPVASIYTLTGTRTGGAILWAVTMVATVAAIVVIFTAWNRGEEPFDAEEPAELTGAEVDSPAPLRLSRRG